DIFQLSAGPPALVGSYSSPDPSQYPTALELVGNTLFVGMDQSLIALDLSNPSKPIQLASMKLLTTALSHSGNLLFVGTSDNKLVALDISKPGVFTAVASQTLASPVFGERVAGSLLVVATGAGVGFYNISNGLPMLPRVVVKYSAQDIAIDGNLVFLAVPDVGLVIIDNSDLSHPIVASETALPIWPGSFSGSDEVPLAVSVAVKSGIVYVGSANGQGSIYGFEYGQPAHPRLVSLVAYGPSVDSVVFTMAFNGNDMFVGGNFD